MSIILEAPSLRNKIIQKFKRETNEGNLTNVRFTIDDANDHYAGFGPGRVIPLDNY